MKNVIIFIAFIISILVLTSCSYDYHMPDQYVEFRFKVELDNIYLEVVKDHGYIPAQAINGDSYSVEYYNDKDELLNTDIYGFNYYEKERYFTAPRESEYFVLKMECFGKTADYNNTEHICTIYIKQSLAEHKLWAVDNMPPYIFQYNKDSITDIEYCVDKRIDIFINVFSTYDINNAVGEYGYELLDSEKVLYYIEDDQMKILERLMGSGEYSISDVGEVGIYCDCYGQKNLSGKVLICRIYSKMVSTEYLEKNSSSDKPYKFEVDHIEYFVDKQYIFFSESFSAITKINAVVEYGYDILSNDTYFYNIENGVIKTLGTLVGLEGFSTDVEQVGIYCDCYGQKNLSGKVLVCRIYSKMVSTEYLEKNSSSDKPYKFEVDHIEYFVDKQ